MNDITPRLSLRDHAPDCAAKRNPDRMCDCSWGNTPELRAKRIFRVVDENWITVWTGECENCAEKVAAANPLWMVA